MGNTTKISSEQRRQMIAESAYFRAERRGFDGGDSIGDWLAAEAEVDIEIERLERERVLERLEEGLAAAGKKLASLKRKASSLKSDARSEWQQDVEKLAKLRETLQSKVVVLREQGERAGQRVRQQAEAVWAELSETVRRVGTRAHH